MNYDVLIIGAGAAGMTAAIYTCRRKLKTAIVSVDIGGQTLLTNQIDNYPGIYELSGPELMRKFEEHTKKFGSEFIPGKVNFIEKMDGGFRVKLTNGESYEAKVIILAYGKVPRTLGIKGEEKFMGRGVSTCVICDAPFFEGKGVAVVGGGNSAVEAALSLAEVAEKVYLVHRRNEFVAEEITQERLKTNKKIELVLESVPVEIKGKRFVKSLVVEGVENKEKREIELDGVFIEIGYAIQTDFIKDLVKLNEKNEIIVNHKCETSTPGIFAAGDLTDVPYKQTIVSAGEGCRAALAAYSYIKGTDRVFIDWK